MKRSHLFVLLACVVALSGPSVEADDVYGEFTFSSVSCEEQHGTEFAYLKWTTNTYNCHQTSPYIMIYRRFVQTAEWEYLDISYNYGDGQYVDYCPIGQNATRHIYYKLVPYCPSCEYATDVAHVDTAACCSQ